MGYCPGFESVQKGFTSRSLIKTRLLTKYDCCFFLNLVVWVSVVAWLCFSFLPQSDGHHSKSAQCFDVNSFSSDIPAISETPDKLIKLEHLLKREWKGRKLYCSQTTWYFGALFGNLMVKRTNWCRSSNVFLQSSDRIARNRKTIVCPMIDVIDHDHFGYETQAGDAMRGAFDWEMYYKRIPIPPELQKLDPSDPFE